MSPHPVICTSVPELAVVWLRSPCTAPGYVVTLLALLSRFPPLCLLEILKIYSSPPVLPDTIFGIVGEGTIDNKMEKGFHLKKLTSQWGR